MHPKGAAALLADEVSPGFEEKQVSQFVYNSNYTQNVYVRQLLLYRLYSRTTADGAPKQ
jgi:hypothetical protein